ncbi:AraC family transcriptional regulator [Solibacillus sp. FSL W8-0474]|uniref:Helix-turn-helix transcriptional regulator n=1 Tax=Solibacillus merdavium TaxID=2762218 RepID=A0ABR8XKI4_9BACL|nr:AraC family transcriptional regulator [Solibacillus merdavium]MBD8032455.1 helix-turn-helix transcriptional regulator [Solibacillus merdavium]
MYSLIVQDIITTLEDHLLEHWQLEDYAKKIGYSKFHLTRSFKKETGLTIGEYIRKRRLAMASLFLLHSDLSIMEISLECHFQSQEAFTRAFKELYNMPPGKYRNLMKSIMRTEEQEMTTSNEVKGWFLSGTNPAAYTMKADTKVFHTGTKSGYLGCTGAMDEVQFGTMMQSFSAKNWVGKRFKMSCFIKTKEAMKCGAWCRIDSKNGDLLQFDNMDNRAIHGTTDWNYYSIVLDVPEDSASIHFGLLLSGAGEAWIDGIKFEEVEKSVATTNMIGSDGDLPLEPVNLGFDDF